MGLVAVEGILETVMKVADVDHNAATELVRFGLYESLCDQIDEHREALEDAATEVLAKRAEKARTVLLRTHVGKALDGQPEPDDLAYAQGLAVIDAYVSKSLIGDALQFFNQSHPRDDKGRFTRQDVRTSGSNSTNVRHDQHGKQALDIVNRWKRAGLIDDNSKLMLHWKDSEVDPRNGKLITGTNEEMTQHAASELTPQRLADLQAEHGDSLTLSGVSVGRGSLAGDNPKQRAAMDALATFSGGDPAIMEGAGRFVRHAPNPGDWTGAGQEWNRSGDHQGFRRMSMTGRALQSVSAPGSSANMIGGVAQLLGDLGPEAEKVLGPGIRRTAYRYRGTERKPSQQLDDSVEYANAAIAALNDAEPGSEQREHIESQIHRRASARDADAASHITAYYAGKRGNRDQIELRASGDITAAILQNNLPDPKIAALSIASGDIPPSEGVIINSDGHVVSQAQGVKGDHYLPFDLKNLGSLRGGQYVRTRLAGGPSTEDIYTGLMTGARQLQVVSHSGVFTVEFDPNLRGGRRYSDKARRMVSRYEKLVGTLANENVTRQDISPAEQARMKREAYRAANWDEDQGKLNFQADLKRKRAEASIGLDEEDLETAAHDRAKDSPEWNRASPSQRGEIIRDARRAIQSETSEAAYRMYRLDGPGYDAALKALKQEFPYFIRNTSWMPLPEWLEQRGLPRGDRPSFGPPDKGYVPPDKLTPFDRGSTSGALAERPAEGTQTERAGASRPGAAPAAAGAAQKPKGNLAQVTSVAPRLPAKLAESLFGALSKIGTVSFGADIPMDYNPELARSGPSVDYLKWVWMKHGQDPEKFGTWLTTQASHEDREAVKDGLRMYSDIVPGLPNRPDLNEAQITQSVDDATRLMNLLEPFAPLAENPVLAAPPLKAPKPQPFPDIVGLTTEAELGQFAVNMEHRDPFFGEALSLMSGNTSQVPGLIREAVTEYTQGGESNAGLLRQIEAMQRAWAYLKATEVVGDIDALGLAGEGAPKAPAPQGAEKPVGKSLSRGQLKPLHPHRSPATKALVEKFLSTLTR